MVIGIFFNGTENLFLDGLVGCGKANLTTFKLNDRNGMIVNP